MPRTNTLITSDGVPATSADVAAAEAAAIAAAAIQSAADAAAAQAAAIAASAPNTVVAGEAFFHAFLGSDQVIAAGGLTDTILFDQVVADDGSNYNPVTGEWTCPADGVYRVQGRVGGGATGDEFVGQVFVDAGPSILTDGSATPPNASNLPGALLDVTLDLNAAQVVTIRVTETKAATPGFNVAGALSLENTHFTVYRVR